MSVKNLLKMVAVSILIGIAAVWAIENFLPRSNCYDFKQSATILQSLKQDPVWRGIVVKEQQERMIAVFGNNRTGSWTRVEVDTKGNVCFLETGTNFQNVAKNTIDL